MKSACSFRFSSVFFLVILIHVAIANAQQCTYSFNIKTGGVNNAGTDSRISIVLGDESHTMMFADIAQNGVMERGHDYFERGNMDFFVVKGTCFDRTVCRIIITSDNTGNKPGWFVESVEVIQTEPNRPRKRNLFWISQWLATDMAPFQLSTRRNICGM